ncbi:vitamin K epoxide reductase family protein [uncultured Corynebacterium sp.]|uniref:vitamin K epoxide reductase family protein n=1 Tax=uncultured Corynebacterium sp. TaxID=159447 RepID=UPI0025E7D911|nr:vitamin K epoxide reductase family protein [uncultured Corynebacterium sp.]
MSNATTGGQAPRVPTTAAGTAATAGVAEAAPGFWGGSRLYGLAVTLLGAVGLYMSGLIMYDKIELMKDPDFVPACTINDVISCTDVMQSSQASVFVFPNPFIGLFGFGVVITVGVALLAGARFRAWFWYGFLAGLVFAVGFVHWLAFEAVYSIEALCPYCMVVWSVVLPLFLITLVHIVWERQRDAAGIHGADRYSFAGGWIMPVVVLVVWYAAFVVLILAKFA